MYKEYRFDNPTKAIEKRKQLKQDFGYDFPLYKIQLHNNEYLSLIHPVGLQPNPKRKHQMPKKTLYPKFEKERKEHPSLSDKVVWRIVYDHEKKKHK